MLGLPGWRRGPSGLRRRLRRGRSWPRRLRRLLSLWRRCGFLIPGGIMRGRRRRTRDLGLRLYLRLRLRLHRRSRGFYSGVAAISRPLRRRLITFHQIRRHTRLRAWHACGKKRLALARKLFLGVEYVVGQHFRRVELTTRCATAEHQHQRKRRTDSNQRGGKTSRRHPSALAARGDELAQNLGAVACARRCLRIGDHHLDPFPRRIHVAVLPRGQRQQLARAVPKWPFRPR